MLFTRAALQRRWIVTPSPDAAFHYYIITRLRRFSFFASMRRVRAAKMLHALKNIIDTVMFAVTAAIDACFR